MTDSDREDQIYKDNFDRIVRWLIGKYVEIDRANAEDITQTAFINTLERLRNTSKRRVENPNAYFCTAANNQATLFLKKHHATLENILVQQMEDAHQCTPEEREKRHRQRASLNNVFRQFVIQCEGASPAWLRRKQLQERIFLFDPVQKYDDTPFQMIQKEMSAYGLLSIDNKKASDLFSADLKRSSKKLHELMKASDMQGTIFETLWSTQHGLGREYFEQIPSPAQKEPTLETSFRNSIESCGDYECDDLPEVRNFRDLARWVTATTDAWCQSDDRTEQFVNLGLSNESPPTECPEELLDVFYHIFDRECRFCRAKLGMNQLFSADNSSE